MKQREETVHEGLGKATILGLISSAANLLASVIRSKVAAITLGPTGVGLSAEVLQWTTLAAIPASAFTGANLTQQLAGASSRTASSAALSWSIASSLVFGLVAIALAPLGIPSTTISVVPLVTLAVVASTASGLVAGLTTTLAFHGRLEAITKNQTIAAIVSAVATAALTLAFGIRGQFVGLAVAAWLSIPLFLIAANSIGEFSIRPVFERTFLTAALRVGATTLVAGIALQSALFVVRWVLNRHGGASANGQFQAAWSVGSLYLGFVLNGMSSYIQPRLANCDTNSLGQILNETGGFALRILAPVALLVLCLRDFALHALYSDAFDGAATILAWQLAADPQRAVGWVFASPLLVRGKLRAFAIAEITTALSLGIGAVALVPNLGLAGIGLAYWIAFQVYAVVSSLIASRTFNTHFPWTIVAKGFLTSMGLTIFILVLDHRSSARVIGVCVAAIWLIADIWRTGLFARLKARIPR